MLGQRHLVRRVCCHPLRCQHLPRAIQRGDKWQEHGGPACSFSASQTSSSPVIVLPFPAPCPLQSQHFQLLWMVRALSFITLKRMVAAAWEFRAPPHPHPVFSHSRAHKCPYITAGIRALHFWSSLNFQEHTAAHTNSAGWNLKQHPTPYIGCIQSSPCLPGL